MLRTAATVIVGAMTNTYDVMSNDTLTAVPLYYTNWKIGVFLMGACLVVTSFTCTAPFVGTLLSLAVLLAGTNSLAAREPFVLQPGAAASRGHRPPP